MKRYLLGLRSGDFTKNGNIWVTDAINLYNNQSYKNYSYKRSDTGLNFIGDFTFVGTEVSSPSYFGDHSTPIDPYAVYKTNYGEVVYEPATPNILRFIDTTSRVDLISYKHAFTNLPGTENPTFNLQVYESDNQNGPWLKSALLIDSNSIFLNNSKSYIKIELEIFSETLETLDQLGLIIYFEVAIHDPITPVISDSARNVLSRFPTWTQMYEDSIESATPQLATPNSNAGKFITALVGEYLDDFSSLLDSNSLDSFISTADEDMIDWIYVSYNIPATASSVIANGIQLAKAPSLEAFYSSKKTDYIYYHNLIDSQILTLQKFNSLLINGISYEQDPSMLYNIFDEFGVRVNLQRLYLEDNASYKKRILDVYVNPPGVGEEALKRTLRRELDIWRAYGATPDSNYLGATPEIMEMSDIENSTPYFSFNGNPTDTFIQFVRYINETYPSNMGYVNWDEGIWDYAGLNGEGVGRIPAVYDVSTPGLEYFQPGVGDFEDLQLVLPGDIVDSATNSFSGYFKGFGYKLDSYEDVYGPVTVDYTYKASYTRQVVDPFVNNPNSATPFNGGVALVYEVVIPPNSQSATPQTFYTNLSYNDRDDLFVYNYLSQTSAASPEYNYISLVNSDGFTNTNLFFNEKTYGYSHINELATPVTNSIDVSQATSISVINKVRWNQITQSYETVPTGNYRISFNDDPRGYFVNPSVGQSISISTPNIDYYNSNLKIGSIVYGTKVETGMTKEYSGRVVLNDENLIDAISDDILLTSSIKDSLPLPLGSTPQNLYIVNKKVPISPAYNETVEIQSEEIGYGGVGFNPIDNSEYYVPSSPNIFISQYASASNLSSAISTTYFEASTVSYNAAPEVFIVSTGSTSTDYYPFKSPVWMPIGENEVKTNQIINGYIDHLDIVYRSDETPEDSGRSINSQIKDVYLDSFALSKSDFNIPTEQQNNYLITNIVPVSNNQDIVLTSNKNEVLPSDTIEGIVTKQNTYGAGLIEEIYDPLSQEYYFSNIEIYAQKISSIENVQSLELETKEPHVHTGWLYLPEEDYYAYARPVTETHYGQLFEIDLQDIPRQGAPVIVNVMNDDATVQYQNLIFPDEATPGQPTIFNKEIVVGSNDLAVYLSNSNINEVLILDMYTGLYLIEDPILVGYYTWSSIDIDGNYIIDMSIQGEYFILNLEYTLEGNRLQILSAETGQSIIVPGRNYEVTYFIKESYYVDKDFYYEDQDEYGAKVFFSSTPDLNSLYEITYETAIDEFSMESGISLSSIDNPLNEGFIFVSDTEYPFGTANVSISPKYISDSENDIVYLSIVSLDINNNPKPYQTFRVNSSLLTPEDEFVTTNKYGFASVKLRYSGAIPTNATEAVVYVQGIKYADATPGMQVSENSSASPFFEDINLYVSRNSVMIGKSLKSAAEKLVIKANFISDNRIKGFIKTDDVLPASPVVYWRKARTVFDAIDTVAYSTNSATPDAYGEAGMVYANEDGEFEIGPFYSRGREEAGYWYVAVESEISSNPSISPVTIVGDISYWYESYDNIDYYKETVPLPENYYSLSKLNSSITEVPAFKYNYHDMSYVGNSAATINWNPPKWFPINYYEQYQMGLFGATPNAISTYVNIVNDYEES
jgi:hypothetical protein